MKKIFLFISILLCAITASAQTLQEAKQLYTAKQYAEALPVFERELQIKKSDASLNHWYAVCLFETDGDLNLAEQSLQLASKKKIPESNLYLGLLYTEWFDFGAAETNFDLYEKYLTRKGWRSNVQKEEETKALAKLEENKKYMQKLRRMVSHTEDVQIIDSTIVNKKQFLAAYNLSFSGGKLETFNDVFDANKSVNSTVYFNEKETRMYYSMPDTAGVYNLFTMEYLLDHYGNERKMSKDNFGLEGSMNYPFIMPDGVTVYFAAADAESIGGYDLFVSRYNMNTDAYLRPERLNMPFNSKANDYMLVVDEEKGVAWFASDRGMAEESVCIYTFIPNDVVKIIQSEDNRYLANRARISSIKDTWAEGQDYSKLIGKAKTKPIKEAKKHKDFEFVINDDITYYTLSEFKSMKARDAYFKVVQLKSELKLLEENLEENRDKYINASTAQKNSLSHTILGMESKQKMTEENISPLEIEARDTEIESLGKR